MKIKLVLGLFMPFVLFTFLTVGSKAQSNIIKVPAVFPTIQQAINAASDGDTVLVSPGTYVENINFLGKALTVTSEQGPEVTIIDGNHHGPVIKFNSGEGPDSVLSRLTVQHGDHAIDSDGVGGGISIENSSPTIRQNIIIRNTACAGGCGIGIFAGSPLIQGNIVSSNSYAGCLGPAGAGGIFILGTSSAQILDNTISNNSFQNGGGISIIPGGDSAITIRGNIITGNDGAPTGGGIAVSSYSPNLTIVQNLITRNIASWGAGIYIGDTVGEISNNTIADNFGRRGSGIFLPGLLYLTKYYNNIIAAPPGAENAFFCEGPEIDFLPPAVFEDNNFFGGIRPFDGQAVSPIGTKGNISADPLFINPTAGNYRLQPNSPSIDNGDNSASNLPATDLDGNPRIVDGDGDGSAIVDHGGYETPKPFDLCIQDESNGNILKINSTTGEYEFTTCNGFTTGGTGTLTVRGTLITLQHVAGDRRITVRVDIGLNKATASVQVFSQSVTLTITDRNTNNNTCACQQQ